MLHEHQPNPQLRRPPITSASSRPRRQHRPAPRGRPWQDPGRAAYERAAPSPCAASPRCWPRRTGRLYNAATGGPPRGGGEATFARRRQASCRLAARGKRVLAAGDCLWRSRVPPTVDLPPPRASPTDDGWDANKCQPPRRSPRASQFLLTRHSRGEGCEGDRRRRGERRTRGWGLPNSYGSCDATQRAESHLSVTLRAPKVQAAAPAFSTVEPHTTEVMGPRPGRAREHRPRSPPPGREVRRVRKRDRPHDAGRVLAHGGARARRGRRSRRRARQGHTRAKRPRPPPRRGSPAGRDARRRSESARECGERARADRGAPPRGAGSGAGNGQSGAARRGRPRFASPGGRAPRAGPAPPAAPSAREGGCACEPGAGGRAGRGRTGWAGRLRLRGERPREEAERLEAEGERTCSLTERRTISVAPLDAQKATTRRVRKEAPRARRAAGEAQGRPEGVFRRAVSLESRAASRRSTGRLHLEIEASSKSRRGCLAEPRGGAQGRGSSKHAKGGCRRRQSAPRLSTGRREESPSVAREEERLSRTNYVRSTRTASVPRFSTRGDRVGASRASDRRREGGDDVGAREPPSGAAKVRDTNALAARTVRPQTTRGETVLDVRTSATPPRRSRPCTVVAVAGLRLIGFSQYFGQFPTNPRRKPLPAIRAYRLRRNAGRFSRAQRAESYSSRSPPSTLSPRIEIV